MILETRCGGPDSGPVAAQERGGVSELSVYSQLGAGPLEGEGPPFCMAPVPPPTPGLTRAAACLRGSEAGGGSPDIAPAGGGAPSFLKGHSCRGQRVSPRGVPASRGPFDRGMDRQSHFGPLLPTASGHLGTPETGCLIWWGQTYSLLEENNL